MTERRSRGKTEERRCGGESHTQRDMDLMVRNGQDGHGMNQDEDLDWLMGTNVLITPFSSFTSTVH